MALGTEELHSPRSIEVAETAGSMTAGDLPPLADRLQDPGPRKTSVARGPGGQSVSPGQGDGSESARDAAALVVEQRVDSAKLITERASNLSGLRAAHIAGVMSDGDLPPLTSRQPDHCLLKVAAAHTPGTQHAGLGQADAGKASACEASTAAAVSLRLEPSKFGSDQLVSSSRGRCSSQADGSLPPLEPKAICHAKLANCVGTAGQSASSGLVDGPALPCGVSARILPARLDTSLFGSEQLHATRGRASPQAMQEGNLQSEDDGSAAHRIEQQATDHPKFAVTRLCGSQISTAGPTTPTQKSSFCSFATQSFGSSVRTTPSMRASRYSHGHQSSDQHVHDHQEWLCAEVRSVRETAAQCEWHVIDATANHLEESLLAGEASGRLREGLAPPNPDAAVLVLCEVSDIETACQAVRGACKPAQGASSPPLVIALLLGRPSSHGFAQAVVSAHQDLLSGGAQDVIVKCGSDADLSVAVAMAKVRIREKQKQHMHFKRELVRRLQKQKDPAENMFWNSVHLVFNGFPPIDEDLICEPNQGDDVGPLRWGCKLGQGGFGQVFSATNSDTGELEAVKIIDKASLNELGKVSNLWRECKVLRKLSYHENIVQCYGCMHGPAYIFIRMELAGKQNLYSIVKKHPSGLGLEAARNFQSQIASGVLHLHDSGVAHRDLKPENIGVCQDGMVVKLLDFGSAAPIDKECCDMAGTMPFMAPEVLASGDEEPYDPSRCDVWSIAVLLLEMLCGPDKMGKMLRWGRKHPPCPERADELDAFFKQPRVLRSSLEEDLGPIDEGLFTLVDGMLQLDSSKRWSAHQVAEADWLEHVEQQPDA